VPKHALASPDIDESEIPAALETADQLSTAFEYVAEMVKPSVVSIRSSKKIEVSQRPQIPDDLRNSPFRDFFDDDFFERFFGPQGRGRPYVQQGLGTGFVVSEDGYILTNNHVVERADEVSVMLSDGREFKAEIIGTDPKTDVAVIKVDGEGLQPVTLGDSDDLRVGGWVVAVGNPFGLSSTITAGIVSATGRSRVGIADYEDFIQTDAAINPGNSGGPLVNLRGEVIGINTAIFSRSGGYMGIGFAIPVNMAKSIMDSLIAEGRVVRGWLGVVIQNLDEGLAQSFGYDDTDGVLVSDVQEDSPADRGGLKSGDIIVRFDGRPVENMDELRLRVAEKKPGEDVEVEIYRDGRDKTLEIEIGALESDEVASTAVEASKPDLGMTVRTVTPQIAAQLGYDEDVTGVVVTNVEPLGPAARAGLRTRDVIVSVQGENVENVRQFNRVLERRELKAGVRIVVRSGDAKRFVFLQLPE
jgi:serine protease Do